MIKTRMCNFLTHPCLFLCLPDPKEEAYVKSLYKVPVYLTIILRKITFGFNIDFLYSLCQINKKRRTEMVMTRRKILL